MHTNTYAGYMSSQGAPKLRPKLIQEEHLVIQDKVSMSGPEDSTWQRRRDKDIAMG